MYFSFLLQQQTTDYLLQLPVMLAIGGVFYFLLVMPMQKQKKKAALMLAELKNGDIVVTNGGIIGTITALDSDTIVLRVKPDNLKIQFARSAVNSMAPVEGSK